MTNPIAISNRPGRAGGFGLLDGLLYLGLAAVAIGGVFSVYRSASTSSKSNDLVTSVGTIASNVRSLYSTGTYPSTSSLEYTLAGANLLPSGFTGTGPVYNPFGGTLAITGATATSSTPSTFVVTLTGLPSAACAAISQGFGQIGGGAALVVQGTASSLSFQSTTTSTASVASFVGTDCAAAGQGSGAGNNLTLTFL